MADTKNPGGYGTRTDTDMRVNFWMGVLIGSLFGASIGVSLTWLVLRAG